MADEANRQVRLAVTPGRYGRQPGAGGRGGRRRQVTAPGAAIAATPAPEARILTRQQPRRAAPACPAPGARTEEGRSVLVELVVGGAFLVASLIVIGVFVAMFSLIVWLVVLPFKLLGLLFHSALWLVFAVPFMLLLGFVGMVVL